MIWGLRLLCLAVGLGAVHAGPIRKTGKIEDKVAPQEEVNVLMFGVIQICESLNDVYETTEAKIAKVSQTLKRYEGDLQNLVKQTEQAAEVEKQIKAVVQLLQTQMASQEAHTKMTKDYLTRVEKEGAELKTKVKRLETYLNNSVPTNVKELKERAQEHSNILKGLQHLTQFQKENIDTQDEKLSKLQKMSEAMG
ncbi:uncharacterized protein angptl8 [Acanthochromis polyacanthus]|uniref:uncharacterized protein angptl8 n=1 Tax=Acanthochromis polyacanthus TaxID=80966 RepID=UPI00223438CA|nr:uncharacterized protein angptl8 [Acanthochromis polyacanthus]